MASKTQIDKFKKEVTGGNLESKLFQEALSTYEKVESAGLVLELDTNKNFWAMVATVNRLPDVSGESEVENFQEALNISQERLDTYINAFVYFAGSPEVISENLDRRIYEFAVEKLNSGKAELDKVIDLLKQAIHHGFSFEQFKKALNKVSGSVSPSKGAGKKTQVRFVYPVYDFEQDEAIYMEEMSAAFYAWQEQYSKDIEKERGEREGKKNPFFEE